MPLWSNQKKFVESFLWIILRVIGEFSFFGPTAGHSYKMPETPTQNAKVTDSHKVDAQNASASIKP